MQLFPIDYNFNGKLVLDNFIHNNSIRIPRYYWERINFYFGIDEIKDGIINTIRKNELPIPGAFVGEEGQHQAHLDFFNLKSLDSKTIINEAIGRITTRKKYKYKISNYYLQTSSVGNDCSDFFQRHNRVKCGTSKFDSPKIVWYDNDKLHYCLNALWSLKVNELNENILFSTMALRQYVASQFRVSSAKAIYELFNAERVLDTSAGWGDRFAGFSAASCTKEYLGIDPNTSLHSGYIKQAVLYNTGKNYNFLKAPAEDVILPFEYFDLMFTSPPYFGTEKYSNEKTQSWRRYGKLESWLNDFLLVVIKNTWRSLKSGGYLAINIADLGIGSFKDDTKICDVMNDYIKKLKGAEYVGCLGLRLTVRPHTGIKKEMPGGSPIFIEPIWIWRKGLKNSISNLVKDFKSDDHKYMVRKINRVELKI